MHPQQPEGGCWTLYCTSEMLQPLIPAALLCIIAAGKTGPWELAYLSDVLTCRACWGPVTRAGLFVCMLLVIRGGERCEIASWH